MRRLQPLHEVRGAEVLEFEEYVASRGPAMLRLAFLLTGDALNAREIAQAALAKAFGKWARISASDQPDAYVRRVLVNTCIDTYRRRREVPVDPADPALDVGASGDHADVTAARAEMWQALSELSRQQRAVLVLRFYEGYDDAGIAEVLNCAPSTVRSNAARGLAALRAHPAFIKNDNLAVAGEPEPSSAVHKGAQR